MITAIFVNTLAAASPAPGGARDPKAEMISTFVMLGLFSVIFYFAVIRPQRLRAKEMENKLKTLKPGDKILTSGGVLGTIITIKDKSLSIRSEDTKLEIIKSAVTEITERRGESVEAKS